MAGSYPHSLAVLKFQSGRCSGDRRKAVNEIGPLQALWHYGGEWDREANGITLKGDEKCLAEMLGIFDIGHQGYAGFELCHPLPAVNGQTVGLDAAEYMRGMVAEAKKLHASEEAIYRTG